MPIDVLIVGAGPTGLLLASVLARYGVTLRLIDKNPYPSRTSKALTVFARTLEIFDQLGIAETAISRGRKLSEFQMYANGKPLAQMSLTDIDSCFPFVLCLPQSETEHLLETSLETFGVRVERSLTFTGLTQDDQGVTATLCRADGQSETCETKWLIGCDGARSTVREVTGLTQPSTSLDTTIDLADVQLDWALPPDQFRIFYAEDGVVGVVPLPQVNYWRLIVSLPPDTEPSAAPNIDFLEQVMIQRSHHTVHLSHPIWTSRFSIRQRMVESVRNQRVLVAGDALSSHSPLGGQGMNAGLQDAYNLAWKLALVIQNKASEELLDSYEAERKPVSKALLSTTGRATRIMLIQNPILQHLRHTALRFGSRFNVVQHRIANLLSELTVNYRNSPIVQKDAFSSFGVSGKLQAGDRAPDVVLQAGENSLRLLQVLSPLKHTLLLFSGQNPSSTDIAKLSEFAQAAEQQFPDLIAAHLICLTEPNPEAVKWGRSFLLDATGEGHRRYCTQNICLYLIRPDGYIGFHSPSPEISQLNTYLKNLGWVE